ncbi:MAG: hypothetical protein KAI29_14340, partial [Cyclobacteriaceae bacterium]|nr:hypothetical protein [Cyclobacteriaceae bacterium]
LEGNFAFASGINEMLLQSHTGIVHVFPAIPADWKNVAFDNLRTEGAFLVSAKFGDGVLETVEIHSEKGGEFKMKNTFSGDIETDVENIMANPSMIELSMKPGETVLFKLKK